MITDTEQSRTLAEGTLDDLDRRILSMLQQDGRMPYRQIARQLGVSEGTIRSRTGRMEEQGVLNIVAIADPFLLGYRVLAFLLIKVEPGHQNSVIQELVSWPESTYVSDCIGQADIYVQIVCHDNDHLHTLLRERVANVEGIQSVETCVELKMHKVSYQYT